VFGCENLHSSCNPLLLWSTKAYAEEGSKVGLLNKLSFVELFVFSIEIEFEFSIFSLTDYLFYLFELESSILG